MIMADVLKFVFLILGALIVFVSYWLAAEALFPGMVERARSQYHSHALKITLLGLALAAPLIALGIIVGKAAHPSAKMVSVAIIAVPVLLGLVGSAGLCKRIGSGLTSPIDEQQPWRRVLRGGVVLAFTFLLPVIGWFIVMPWAVVSGLGAAFASFTRRERPAEVVAPVGEAKEVIG